MDFIYESEFEETMSEYFLSKYGLWSETLQKYLLLRYMIIKNQKDYKKITLEDFSKFIADELNICTPFQFTYKKTPFMIYSASGQSISNIIQNTKPIWSSLWGNFSSLKFECGLNEEYIEITKNLPTKIKRSKSENKEYLKHHYLLGVLNFNFGVEPDFVRFPHVPEIKEGLRTYEEICEAYVKNEVFDTFDTSNVLEKDVEDYLFKNLKELFNITPLQRQYQIAPDCIADIFGKDDRDIYLVELKNTKDQRLLWQLVNYHRHMPNAKIIAASTYWQPDILDEITKLGYVTAYNLRPHISMGKIDKVEVFKLS